MMQQRLALDPGPNAEHGTPNTSLVRSSAQARSAALSRAEILAEFCAAPRGSQHEYAARMGVSVGTLYRMRAAWRAEGAAALARESKPESERGHSLGPAFVEYFRGICQQCNTRSVAFARRVLVDRLRRGQEIPGLGTWRELWARKWPAIPVPAHWGAEYQRGDIETLLPRSMAPRTLRRYVPEPADLAAARQGSFAASKYGPFVYTTRVGLSAGEVLIFDDVWHNVSVNYMGSSRALRPLELCCLDALSAHKIAWGMRPRLWNEADRKYEGIKSHEMLFLLAAVLCDVGYRRDGTTLWVERGTAAIDETVERIVTGLSAGAIRVMRAPLRDARQMCSMFRGAGRGNPRFKSRLESHFNIQHTELSLLQGQVGRNADVAPEELVGRDQHNSQLLRIRALLPPELASLMDAPFLQWDEYFDCVCHAYDRMAARTWHKLEGWEACRFFSREFHLPPASDWTPMAALEDMHPDACAAIRQALEMHPEWCRIRPMSPVEVWERHASGLVKLPPSAVPLILGPKNGVVRKCPPTAEITFASRVLGPVPHIYPRDYSDEQGRKQALRPGDDYLFHINPFSAGRELYVSRPDGAYLGAAARIAVPCMTDAEAVRRRMGEKRAAWAQMFRRVSGRNLTLLARQAAATARNTAIVGAALDAGLLPAAGKPDPAPDAPPDRAAISAEADEAILELCQT